MAQEGEKLDKDALMREAMVGQRKERMELERKVQSQARKADHLERARREEEGPLLQATYERRLEVPTRPPPLSPLPLGRCSRALMLVSSRTSASPTRIVCGRVCRYSEQIQMSWGSTLPGPASHAVFALLNSMWPAA